MGNAWLSVRWITAAVMVVYLVIQIFAMLRLDGDHKRRAGSILMVMLVAVLIETSVRDVFENRVISRVLTMVVGAAAVVSTGLLLRLFRNHKLQLRDAGR